MGSGEEVSLGDGLAGSGQLAQRRGDGTKQHRPDDQRHAQRRQSADPKRPAHSGQKSGLSGVQRPCGKISQGGDEIANHLVVYLDRNGVVKRSLRDGSVSGTLRIRHDLSAPVDDAEVDRRRGATRPTHLSSPHPTSPIGRARQCVLYARPGALGFVVLSQRGSEPFPHPTASQCVTPEGSLREAPRQHRDGSHRHNDDDQKSQHALPEKTAHRHSLENVRFLTSRASDGPPVGRCLRHREEAEAMHGPDPDSGDTRHRAPSGRNGDRRDPARPSDAGS